MVTEMEKYCETVMAICFNYERVIHCDESDVNALNQAEVSRKYAEKSTLHVAFISIMAALTWNK